MRLVSRRRFIAWLVAGSASVWVNTACTPSQPKPVIPAPAPTATAASGPGLAGAAIFEPPPVRLTAPPEPGRITPTDRFYVLKYSPTLPTADLSLWGLQVAGQVERTLTLTWNNVQARPQITAMRTLECISNLPGGGLIGNATWQGISLRDLLNAAGVKPSARFVTFEAQDEYYTTVPLERALDERALLVHTMNGQPLSLEHGFPLRVLLVGVYGQKQPKWISRIAVTDLNEQGPWELKGWSNVAAIKVNSRIEAPAAFGRDAQIKRGERTLIAGMAFSGPSGIRRVEVSTDRGQTWQVTTLVPAPAPFDGTAWTGWYTWWTPAQVGRVLIQSRATDGEGNQQGQEQARGILAGVFPDGTSAIHQIQVTVEI
jgi:DMSO/TMAO reductase YedYZ molybdopterin-dependent catalytic subunit